VATCHLFSYHSIVWCVVIEDGECWMLLVSGWQVKLYERQRPLKVDNERLKSRCKQLSDELAHHKQLLTRTQDVSSFSLCLAVCQSLSYCLTFTDCKVSLPLVTSYLGPIS